MADARTIFLSSTFLEFEAARAELELALWRAGFRVFYLGGAASETTVANCCDHVSRADIVIVLLGASYGSTPDGRDVSYTEIEVDHAHETDRAVLAYLLDRAPTDARQARLRQKVAERHKAPVLADDHDLRGRVLEDLLREQLGPPRPPSIANVTRGVPNFVGRGAQMRAIANAFADQPVVVVTGPSGRGKTALAWHYAWHQRTAYDVVWWVRGYPRDAFDADVEDLDRALAGHGDLAPRLSHHGRWLVIVDDPFDGDEVRRRLEADRGNLLITTQDRGLTVAAHELVCPPWSESEVLEYLRQRVDEPDVVAALVPTPVPPLPGVVEQLARAIVDGDIGPADLATWEPEPGPEATPGARHAASSPHRGVSPDLRRALATTLGPVWKRTVARLRAEDPAAAAVLEAWTLVAPVASEGPAMCAALRGITAALGAPRDHLVHLHHRGLLRREGGVVTQHPIVQIGVAACLEVAPETVAGWLLALSSSGLGRLVHNLAYWAITKLGADPTVLPALTTSLEAITEREIGADAWIVLWELTPPASDGLRTLLGARVVRTMEDQGDTLGVRAFQRRVLEATP